MSPDRRVPPAATEQHASGSSLSLGSFHGLAIEGELAVKLLSTEGPDPAAWHVAYTPVVELHHGTFDGPATTRAAELIARNCIHAGVVATWEGAPECALSAVPLEVPLQVSIDGDEVEAPVLAALCLEGATGPLATVSWLAKRLKRHGRELKAGQIVLTATPGDLIPIQKPAQLSVTFAGRTSSCSVTAPDSKL